MRIVLGVSGGIAVYKAVHIVRLLREAGHDVTVIPTSNALNFVGAPTWEAISGKPVTSSVFDSIDTVQHVRIGQEADLVIVAPATAHTLARIAAGFADDLLTSTILTTTAPILVAPAMHTEMWENAATRANIATLQARGIFVLEPGSGRLTGADSGIGRLPEPAEIVSAALALETTSPEADLAGRRIVVSAGGTREIIDPVRFIANRSSGRQGIALAVAAAQRGAEVTLIAANTEEQLLASPAAEPNITVQRVETTAELQHSVLDAAAEAHVVIMAAAVADFRPVDHTDHKIKKSDGGDHLTITLQENPDILRELVASRQPGQVIVGFAAETGDETADALTHGKEKARRKEADLLAINVVGAGQGFGDVANELTIVDAAGDVLHTAAGSKTEVAHALLDVVTARLSAQ